MLSSVGLSIRPLDAEKADPVAAENKINFPKASFSAWNLDICRNQIVLVLYLIEQLKNIPVVL